MIDIVTVVFEQELLVLKLQAQSIELYCQDIGIRNIYVIVNDDDSVVQKIDTAWWGSLSQHVIKIPKSDFNTHLVDDGWVSQQVLKMLGAAMSSNTWTMILDAKTIIVKPMLVTDIIKDGRAQVGVLKIYPVFEPSRNITNSVFNIDLQQQLGPGGVPFFVHNDTVRDMMIEIVKRTNQSFSDWFQKEGRVTEFILYSGYVQFRYGNFDTLYGQQSKIFPCNLCHSEVKIFDSKFNSMKGREINTVSIHRNAWTQLSSKQQQQYSDLLREKGIK